MDNILSNIKGRFAVVIPAYNHDHKIRDVVEETLKLGMPVIVVDDGSIDSTFERISTIDGILVLRHQTNQGKGAAIMTGFAEAVKVADWAITIDADGQHHPADAIGLIKAIPEGRRPIVVGTRQNMQNTSAPWTSRFGRSFSNFWVWVSGGPLITDSQSGFRIYPLPEVMGLDVRAKRFQFEVEVLVRAKRRHIDVIEAPVSVIYNDGSQRISHFRPFVDFLRNFRTFSLLITQRICSAGTKPQRLKQ
ncbi:Glycosyl transferase [uncultured Desulfobacterium sp.]|uniref:Glycosyl transferase n=1 Tax=uncultured Desulfobacterium sp. TaxID=201089 RepID=A0A445N370_9BACT|nr:Glycosyl transferase [uncultured Desulfobacterium sp.]